MLYPLKSNKIARDGGWYNNTSYCKVINRDHDSYSAKDSDLGFRIVLETN